MGLFVHRVALPFTSKPVYGVRRKDYSREEPQKTMVVRTSTVTCATASTGKHGNQDQKMASENGGIQRFSWVVKQWNTQVNSGIHRFLWTWLQKHAVEYFRFGISWFLISTALRNS